MSTIGLIPASPTASRSRAPVRSQQQAIVVVERRMARQGDPKIDQIVPGWQWTLGNARIGDLFDQLFAEARLTWSSLVVPEEATATFASLSPHMAAQQSVVPYDGTLQIRTSSLTTHPGDGEPVYLIFNGDRFPICDLNSAILVHRQNRCD